MIKYVIIILIFDLLKNNTIGYSYYFSL